MDCSCSRFTGGIESRDGRLEKISTAPGEEVSKKRELFDNCIGCSVIVSDFTGLSSTGLGKLIRSRESFRPEFLDTAKGEGGNNEDRKNGELLLKPNGSNSFPEGNGRVSSSKTVKTNYIKYPVARYYS